MKKFSLLFSLLAMLTIFSCGDDDSPTGNTLSYDGENATGPNLVAGEHEAAVLFPASIMAAHVGKTLDQVQWFMGQAPASCTIKIYDEGTNNSPGSVLYTADVSNALQTPAWNDHTLSTPVTISGKDLWISVRLTHDVQQQSIGCDAGPNVSNGDWLFSSTDGNWSPYTVRTPESINWNIRGFLSE